jgi:hypothetical protein
MVEINQMLRGLMEKGIDIRTVMLVEDNFGFTPLHYAVANGWAKDLGEYQSLEGDLVKAIRDIDKYVANPKRSSPRKKTDSMRKKAGSMREKAGDKFSSIGSKFGSRNGARAGDKRTWFHRVGPDVFSEPDGQ